MYASGQCDPLCGRESCHCFLQSKQRKDIRAGSEEPLFQLSEGEREESFPVLLRLLLLFSPFLHLSSPFFSSPFLLPSISSSPFLSPLSREFNNIVSGSVTQLLSNSLACHPTHLHQTRHCQRIVSGRRGRGWRKDNHISDCGM